MSRTSAVPEPYPVQLPKPKIESHLCTPALAGYRSDSSDGAAKVLTSSPDVRYGSDHLWGQP